MRKHLFEQAADILSVELTASPTTIGAAYRMAKALAEKPRHLIEMAHHVLSTTTARFREHAVRAYYRAMRFAAACDALQDTPEQRRAYADRERETRLLSRPGALERSIGYLHAAMGHY
jgi:hypothetical protein